MDRMEAKMNERMDKIEAKMDRMEAKMNERMDKIEAKLDRLLQRK